MARSFSASHIIVAAVFLLAGLGLASLAPRSDARALQVRIDELEARECGTPGSPVGQQIVNAFRGRPWVGSGSEDGDVPAGEPVSPQAAPGRVEPPPSSGPRLAASEEELGAVVDALELRRAQARQALQEQANPTPAQLEQIDRIVEDMNTDLVGLAEDILKATRETGGEPGRRDSMLFARDALDVLVGTEDAIYDTLEPGQRDNLDEAVIDPLSYIDGGVVESLGMIGAP